MARRKGHVYIVDSKTGGVYSPSEINDNGLELVDSILENEEDARTVLDQLQHKYDKERLMSLNVYKDGQLVLEGTEYYTRQAGLDAF